MPAGTATPVDDVLDLDVREALQEREAAWIMAATAVLQWLELLDRLQVLDEIGGF